MNIKSGLLEDYVNCVETTSRQNTYFKLNVVLFVKIVSLFLFFFYSNNKMNNTFYLQQLSQTRNLDNNLILRQYKLDLKARFIKKIHESKIKKGSSCKRIRLFK